MPRVSIALCYMLFFSCASFAASVERPTGDLIGAPREHIATYDDTLIELAQRYDVGYIELRAANPGIEAWLPGGGARLTLPTMHILPDGPRRGIVINLAELRLYYFREGQPPRSYPVGLGSEGWETPLVSTEIVAKKTHPFWYPPPSIRAERPDLPSSVPPGPDNPLGTRAMYLGFDTYVLHGTNRPAGVGRYVSHGCIRMYELDVRELYEMVDVGTPIAIIYQTTKLGWSKGALYMEVHPLRDQATEIEETGTFAPSPEFGIEERVLAMVSDPDQINWNLVGKTLRERRGIPVRINY